MRGTIPSPEIGPPESATKPASAAPVAALPPHPLLTAFDKMRAEGRPWEALLGFQRTVAAVDQLSDPTSEEQAAWIGAVRRGIETAITVNAPEEAFDQIRRSAAWFQQPHWQRWRQATSDQFHALLRFAIGLRRYAEALELFERARHLVQLDVESRSTLAQAAAGLERTDTAAASLYVDYFEAGQGDADERHRMLALLRRAILIDLASPDEAHLAEFRELNERLWSFRSPVWCAANRAIGCVRTGRVEEALSICRGVPDIEEADADALLGLAVVWYVGRCWPEALNALSRSAKLASAPGAEQLYSAMTRIQLKLSGQVGAQTRDELLEQLRTEAAALQSHSRAQPMALDADWVLGTALFLLGRDRESLDAFSPAPPRLLAWRYVSAQVEAMVRLGEANGVAGRIEQLQAESPRAAPLLRLVAAKEALRQWRFEEAQGAMNAVSADDLGPSADADLPAVRECLRFELSLAEPAAVAGAPSLGVPAAGVSSVVQAWLMRLQCRWHLERNETAAAAELLEQPVHWFAPQDDVRRLEAAHGALAGKDETAVRSLFEQLATAPGAQPADHVSWGLWLCGHGEHEQARATFARLAALLPHCLELRLGWAEAELAAGGDKQHAVELLEPLEGHSQWTTPRRLVCYRPWQTSVPVTLWTQTARVSVHRIADMLHGADLMIRADRVERALKVVGLAEDLLGEVRPALDPQLGRVYQRACVAEMEAGHLQRACELHERASQFGCGDPDFAVRIAQATTDRDAMASEPVLGILLDWVHRFGGREEELDPSPVGLALQRFLLIDGATPDSPAELEQRKRGTTLLHEAKPAWDWPKRNLAREAARGGRHGEVVALVQSISAPTGDDHFLCGRSAWDLDRFELAADALGRAIDAGKDVPEVRAWRGCARAAIRFQRWLAHNDRPGEEELDQLLGDLGWMGCEAASQVRVRVWHGAVLVAAGKTEPAMEVLDIPEAEGDLRTAARTLRGLALLAAGRGQEAAALWESGDDPLATSLLEQSLRILVRQHQPGRSGRAAVAGQLLDLRRRGAQDEAFHLATAQCALWEGNETGASESLEQAREAALLQPLAPRLAPLRLLLDDEHEALRAQLLAGAGNLAEAAEAFAKIAATSPWRDTFLYRSAVCLIGAGDVDRGEAMLAEVLNRNPSHADAEAQWALVRARRLAWEEAEEHARRAIHIEPGHPLALWALAEIQEGRGDAAAAAATYRSLVEEQAGKAGKRLVASGLLALGRLEQAAGRLDTAEACYRRAVQARPDSMPARRRLALLLAVQSPDPSRLDESEPLLAGMAASAPDDVPVALAGALVAHRRQRWPAAAEGLERVLRLPGFRRLAPAIQRGVALWSVEIQLAGKRFGAAAAALQELNAAEPAPEIENRMIQCRLLEGLQLLQQVPMRDDALERAAVEADAVRERRPDHPLANVLAVLCHVLQGGAADEATRQIAARLQQFDFPDTRQRTLAMIVRLLVSDETALECPASLPSDDGPIAVSGQCLGLLLANRSRQLPRLVEEARRMVEGHVDEQAITPFDVNDLVLVGALDTVAQRREDEAAELLEAWHARGRGSARTRRIHSHLLARRAAKALRGKEIGEAHNLLTKAVGVLALDEQAHAP